MSPLRRAKETLKYSSVKYLTLIESPLCREVMGGNIIDYLENEPIEIETDLSITTRVNSLRKMVNELESAGKRVLIISHALFISFFIRERRLISNCEVVRVT